MLPKTLENMVEPLKIEKEKKSLLVPSPNFYDVNKSLFNTIKIGSICLYLFPAI